MNSTEIKALLPEIFRRTAEPGTVLDTLLDVMGDLHRPSEDVLQRIDSYFDPYRTPEAMVPVLASWVDLDRFFAERAGEDAGLRTLSSGTGQLRELIAAAIELSQWRGTAVGLTRMLEVATGTRGFKIDERVVDSGGAEIPFHIRIFAPAAARPHRSLIERILRQEKPVYVTYDLEFAE